MSGQDAPLLDVRPMLASGVEPLSEILAAADRIPVGGSLIVVAPFEPVPLFGALRQMGFSHESLPEQTGGYRIVFTRDL